MSVNFIFFFFLLFRPCPKQKQKPNLPRYFFLNTNNDGKDFFIIHIWKKNIILSYSRNYYKKRHEITQELEGFSNSKVIFMNLNDKNQE